MAVSVRYSNHPTPEKTLSGFCDGQGNQEFDTGLVFPVFCLNARVVSLRNKSGYMQP
jgi:hypothetical protein